MKQLLWQLLAYVVSRPRIADWLIQRAMKTPYTHLEGYMDRFWLFNAYRKEDGQEITPIPWLPSIRIHHIKRRDEDRHHHDHPWDARSIILKNHYVELRLVPALEVYGKCDGVIVDQGYHWVEGEPHHLVRFLRVASDTTTLKFGEYHTITEVPEGGVWTMFITYTYKGTWGFLVNGKKVQWREYMAQRPDLPWADEQKP